MNLTVSMLLPFCIVLLWKLHLYKKNISTIKEMFNALWQQGFVLRYVPQQSGNFVLMLKISSYVVYQDLIINLLSQFTIFVDLIDSIWFGLLLQKFQVLGDSAGSMLGRDMENLIQRARKYKKEFEDSYESSNSFLYFLARWIKFSMSLPNIDPAESPRTWNFCNNKPNQMLSIRSTKIVNWLKRLIIRSWYTTYDDIFSMSTKFPLCCGT